MKFSQNDEEEVLREHLSTCENADAIPHRFLEIGAYSPTTFSNTRRLVEKGWAGIYVEPAPGNFNSFLAEYWNHQGILLVNAAVAASSQLISFWDSGGDAVSSAVPAHVERWSVGHIKFRHYLTKTITWTELLDAAEIDTSPVSVLSLDVEAMNIELFRLMFMAEEAGRAPIERLLPALRVLIIEHDCCHEEMLARLTPLGFKQLAFNGENVIFAR